MTPDERQLLTRFLQDLDHARGVPKDQEADGMIRQTLSANPDAGYWLVQHAIVADQSLHAAQARIAELEGELREMSYRAAPPAAASSFLPPQPSQASPWGQPAQPSYAPPQPDYASVPPQQRPGLFSAQSGLGSFLRNAGTTAAGVAGGEMLFSGLSDMFGRHNGGGGIFGGGQGFVDQPEETIVNNYYDDGNDGGNDGSDDRDNY